MAKPCQVRLAPGSLRGALLAYVIVWILGGTKPDRPISWMLFLTLDFPLGLIYFPISAFSPPSTGNPLQDWPNFWGPALFFGALGTAWWYLIGVLISRIARRGGDRAPSSG